MVPLQHRVQPVHNLREGGPKHRVGGPARLLQLPPALPRRAGLGQLRPQAPVPHHPVEDLRHLSRAARRARPSEISHTQTSSVRGSNKVTWSSVDGGS
eukprot:5380843-Pyramimonas_sp.AAC.1